MIQFVPSIFWSAAAGVARVPGWLDDDLCLGTHLRVVPTMAVGLPLVPVVLWRIPAQRVDGLAGGVSMQVVSGERVSHGMVVNADPGRPVRLRLNAVPPNVLVIGAEAVPFGDGRIERIALINPATQRLAWSRSNVPYRVAGPSVQQLEVRARGAFQLFLFVAPAADIAVPDERLSLLVGPQLRDRWYRPVGGERPMDRVRRCAPLRPTVVERPEGPWAAHADPAGEETARLGELTSYLDATFKSVIAAKRREEQVIEQPVGGKRAVEYMPMRALLLHAMDPGVARYLGLMTAVPLTDAETQLDHAWVAASLFALPRRPEYEIAFKADDRTLDQQAVSFARRFADDEQLLRQCGEQDLLLRALGAVALVAPAPDVPSAPEVQLGESSWLRDSGPPADAFRQGFQLPAPGVAPLVALARRRTQGAAFEPRNGLVPGGAHQRTVLLGGPSQHDGQPATSNPSFGIVHDAPLPADGAPWTYRIAQGDLFGRFGPPSALEVPQPPRPPCPKPVASAKISYALVTHDAAARSPGKLAVDVHLPLCGDLAVGTLFLQSLTILATRSVAGDVANLQRALDPDAAAPYHFEELFDLPALLPGQSCTVSVRVTATNTAGETREAFDPPLELTVTDPRIPALPPTATGLIWADRPGVADDVLLRIQAPSPPGLSWRAYITDAAALLDMAPTGTRAEIADAVAKVTNPSREAFRLVRSAPFAESGGIVTVTTTVPRSLRTVQLLKLVPLNASGVEAPFADCPAVPVAIPSDRRPPAPRLETSVSAQGRVRITVIAEGIDQVALREAEGQSALSTSPPPGTRLPMFRLRRSAQAVGHPLYAPELAMGQNGQRTPRPLVYKKSPTEPVDGQLDGWFEGSFEDKTTQLYGRYFYWAEIRMPDERRVKRGLAERLPVGCVSGVEPEQMRSMPGMYSEPSPALMVCPIPPKPPTLKTTNVVCTYGGVDQAWRIDLEIQNGPKTPPQAVGQFIVRVYARHTGAENWICIDDGLTLVDGAAVESYPRDTPLPNKIELRLELVDPVGRAARLLKIAPKKA